MLQNTSNNDTNADANLHWKLNLDEVDDGVHPCLSIDEESPKNLNLSRNLSLIQSLRIPTRNRRRKSFLTNLTMIEKF